MSIAVTLLELRPWLGSKRWWIFRLLSFKFVEGGRAHSLFAIYPKLKTDGQGISDFNGPVGYVIEVLGIKLG